MSQTENQISLALLPWNGMRREDVWVIETVDYPTQYWKTKALVMIE